MTTANPTIVLVHGAFAESGSWNDVIGLLQRQSYPTVAFANPIRGLNYDSDYLRATLAGLDGPLVLVGHSYGGSVMSNAAFGNENVKALVFVAAFAPESGESIGELSGRSPGSSLGDTITLTPLSDGSSDVYIRQELYQDQFAADLPDELAALNAATQRPLNSAARDESATDPAWKTVPSWFIYPELDKNIPLAVHQFMAERADAKVAIEVAGASHSLPVSHADEVADVIVQAARSVTA